MSIANTKIPAGEVDKIFKNAKNIFFIGIGGISMSALAEYCVHLNKTVYGYDATRNKMCLKLEKIAKITYRSDPDNVISADLVVYTGAIGEDNLELKEAKARNIPIISRANLLGYFVSKYKVRIGVSGTHGKSTTTAMLSHIFSYVGHDPTVFCGAVMNFSSSSYLFGKGDCVIFEACEYMNSFLSLEPSDAVVTNIEFDHPDCFKSIEDVKKSFLAYVSLSNRIFVNIDDENSKCILDDDCGIERVTFGTSEKADYRAKIIHTEGKNRFFVSAYGEIKGICDLSVFGKHNVENAICAIAVACENGIDISLAIKALSSFQGTQRRLQFVRKTVDGVSIFSDYAHHPTEIKASLKALYDMGYKKITCLFQPHTYSRTKALYDDFVCAFSIAEKVYILPSYSAREENSFSVSESALANDMGATFIPSFKKAREIIDTSLGDCIVVMGAGDIEVISNS